MKRTCPILHRFKIWWVKKESIKGCSQNSIAPYQSSAYDPFSAKELTDEMEFDFGLEDKI